MSFVLSEDTIRAVLNLETTLSAMRAELLKEIETRIMTALETLTQEIVETKAGVASIGTAVNALVAKYNEVASKLAAAVTPEQVEVAKAEFDAIQVELQKVADIATAVGGSTPPVEPTDPPSPPPPAPPVE